jgi:3-dehydroquinate dehydratase/shikimate dehydrogenase
MNSPAPSLSPNYLRSRIGKVCVAITGDNAAELLERAEALYRDNSFLEFRLDYLAKPLLALPKLKTFLAEHAEVTAIATCRREANGGKFAGNNTAELEVLQKAAAAGFHLVDVELQTAELR